MTSLLTRLEHYPKVFPQPFAEPKYPILVIAHRGFSKIAPENTMGAFQKALESGADMLEFDIQLSRDQEPMIIHDRTLKRTTGHKGKVSDLTVKELKQLDAGSWFHPYFNHERIPTLREVLQLVRGRAMLNIEIKKDTVDAAAPTVETRILELLDEYRMIEHTMISSFLQLPLKRIKAMAPKVSTALLYGNTLKSYQQKIPFYQSIPSKMVLEVMADALNIRKNFLNQAFIKNAQAHGIRLNPFTVDRPQTMKKLIKMGVDGIITNCPDRLVALLKKRYHR